MSSDNVIANPGSGGSSFRSLGDSSNVQYPVSSLAYPTTESPGANVLQLVDATHGLPVAVVGTATVSLSGTPAVSVSGNVSIGNFPATQTVAGTVSVANFPATQPASIADGQNATFGAQADGAAATDTSTASYVSLFKRLLQRLTTLIGQLPTALTGSGNLKVSLQESNAAQAVTGTFWQATQPVSGTISAAQSGTWSVRAQDGGGTGLTSLAVGTQHALTIAVVDGSGNQITSFGGSGGTASNFSSAFPSTGTAIGASDGTNMKPLLLDGSGFLKVNVSAGTVTANAGTGTFAISAASLPLPTGAATAAKQPALGTPGSASTDVLSIQGVASMTPVQVKFAADDTASGTLLNNNDAVTLTLSASRGSATLTVSGYSSGTIVVEGSEDGANWGQLSVISLGAGNPTIGSTIGGNGVYVVSVPDMQKVRARASGALGATTTINLDAGNAVMGVEVLGAVSLATGSTGLIGSVQVTDGTHFLPTMDAAGRAGFQKLTDGANTAAVKAASTAAAATDPALVVAVSPNNTIAVTQSGAWSLSANQSVNVNQLAGTATDTNSGNKSAGTLRVVLATDQPQLTNALKVDGSAATQPVSGTVNAAQSGTWTVQPGNTANTTPWLVTPTPSTALSGSRIKSAASTNGTSVKASAGKIFGLSVSNNTSSNRWLKLYDKATAPTVGTDTPIETILIPPNGGRNVEWSLGYPFATGIAYAITGGVADTDTTATAADDVHGRILYA